MSDDRIIRDDRACRVNEDCIVGWHDNSVVPCRLPSWQADLGTVAPLAETKAAGRGEVLEDLAALACWLERNDRDRNPLLVLEAWDVPTADQQGYLEGLRDAATEIRRLVSKWEAV